MFVSTARALVGTGRLPGVGDDGSERATKAFRDGLQFCAPAPLLIRFIGLYRLAIPALHLHGHPVGVLQGLAAEGLVQDVAEPNVGLREREMEQFEDAPLEFIHLDLALSDPQIAFWRGSVALVAISNDVQPWSQAFTTSLFTTYTAQWFLARERLSVYWC
ncbi:hypothetical protein FIBSPDRAFT_903731 [Athelia psychrophila]|uniref:Exportin-2 central domain-containing protein n=1 Tax=Athelia psychrophila TaxID=1759441 RepID=A0A167VL86_9AGAM|nr:hypothetical protein FIBSPDRAFT_903731 [Fibularhizoctonia sp. CBS 109695]